MGAPSCGRGPAVEETGPCRLTCACTMGSDAEDIHGHPLVGGVRQRHWRHAPSLKQVVSDLSNLLQGRMLNKTSALCSPKPDR